MKVIRGGAKKEVPVVEVDESQLGAHISEVARQSVEETLNGLLDAKANALREAPGATKGTRRESERGPVTTSAVYGSVAWFTPMVE